MNYNRKHQHGGHSTIIYWTNRYMEQIQSTVLIAPARLAIHGTNYFSTVSIELLNIT